ncbi:CHAD domain-containing protein [Methylocaldum sp.]|uniref:CHAD domain-containing protein n=1 Tax=Methylocaldum sp. TaxID=1969727 RepID=UPI002D5A5BFC|nr:CHAD domain-containing protein [Methylocaldum sp.]HYE38028.1 CHAD domain-containing protein [Methylocaldum sp.]
MSAIHPVELIVPSHRNPAELINTLERILNVRSAAQYPIVRTYYDSFDWRLYRSGFYFAVDDAENRLSAVYGTLDSAGHYDPDALDKPPRFARDLPNEKWRNRLEDALGVRALLPQVQLHGTRNAYWLDDHSGHGMFKLTLDAYRVDTARGPLPLENRLRTESANLPRKNYRHILDRVINEFGLEPAIEPLLTEALIAAGKTPADPSALPQRPLDPNLRADTAVKLVLRNLLDVMLINENGVKDDLDAEFLHDFRVAVRRTRAVLSQTKGAFLERPTAKYSREFAALGQVTGEPRDLDVQLLGFESYKAGLPGPMQADLAPLQAFLIEKAAKAHEQLNKHLQSAAHHRLIRDWRIFLEKPAPRKPRSPQALLPIGELVDRRIWKLYRRIIAQGKAVKSDTPVEPIHDLRKTGKKLRYVMELFQGLYSPEQMKQTLKMLKRLQDNLGQFQDAHVQIENSRRYAFDLRKAGAPTETLLAIGALIERLYRRQKTVRNEFADCFGEFAQESHQRRFRQLFAPSRTREKEQRASDEPIRPASAA